MAKISTNTDTAQVADVGKLNDGSNDILSDAGMWNDTAPDGNFRASGLDSGTNEINNLPLNLLARGNDVLDVGDVLSDTASNSQLGGYLHFTVTDAANGIVTLGLDANSASGSTGYTTLATISMPNMSFNAGTTSAEILNTLLQSHEIKF